MEYQLTTGSSFISLDGVPFNLNEKLQPMKKVQYPSNLSSINFEEVIFLEYDDSLEKDAIAKLTNNTVSFLQSFHDTNKLIANTEEAPQLSLSANSANIPQTSAVNIYTKENSSIISQSLNYESINNTSTASSNDFNNSFPVNTLSSSILFPTPVTYTYSNDKPHLLQSANKIDPKDFESEMDPFENMSLKIINDIEELDKVFLPHNKVATNRSAVNENVFSYSNDFFVPPISSCASVTLNSFSHLPPTSYNACSAYETPYQGAQFNNLNYDQSHFANNVKITDVNAQQNAYPYTNPHIFPSISNTNNMNFSLVNPVMHQYNLYMTNNGVPSQYNDDLTYHPSATNYVQMDSHLQDNFYAQRAKSSFSNNNSPSFIRKHNISDANTSDVGASCYNGHNKLYRTKSVPNLDILDTCSNSKSAYLW